MWDPGEVISLDVVIGEGGPHHGINALIRRGRERERERAISLCSSLFLPQEDTAHSKKVDILKLGRGPLQELKLSAPSSSTSSSPET